MAWVRLGSTAPSSNGDWLTLPDRLSYSLIRLSFSAIGRFYRFEYPRGFLRIRLGLPVLVPTDQDYGATEYWNTFFPDLETQQVIDLSRYIIPITSNYVEVRKGQRRYDRINHWNVTVEEFQDPDYLITYP